MREQLTSITRRGFVIGIWLIAAGIFFNWQSPQRLQAAAIAFVQGNAGGYSAVTSLSVAFPSGNTAGNLIVVTARASAQNRTWTVSDTRGNTYNLARQFNSTVGGDQGADVRVYYAYNIAGGANTVYLSISGAAVRLAATVREYGGFGTSNPLDQGTAAEGSSASLNSGPVGTTTANELIVGFGTSSNTATFTAGAGFGNLIQHGIGRIASQDRVVSSTGAYSSTMTISPSLGWASMVVTFKASSSGPDTTPPVISNVQPSNVGQTTATISWLTNELSDSQVEFVSQCPGSGCSTPLNPTMTTSHSVSISGFTPNTLYTYNVKSRDGAGNLATSTNSSFTTTSSSTGGYPIKLSASRKYLLDYDDRPTLINGDTAWSLIAQLTKADAEDYLIDRGARGYNLIVVNLLEYSGANNAPANIYGDEPFTTPGNFNTPNEAYFAHADWVINKAAENGITVLLTPLYLGYNASQGWRSEVQNSSLATMRAYGRYVGNRYKNYPNIIWMIGGDTDPAPWASKVLEFVAGIKDYDTTHLMTAHNVPEHGTMDYWPNQSWLDLNNIYTYVDAHSLALAQHNRVPFKPFFLVETFYEREHSSTPLGLRRQAYWTVLSGGLLGHIFGNCPIWHFSTPIGNQFCAAAPWQSQLSSVGSVSLSYVGPLFESRQFYNLVPDQNHTVLTAGYQSGTTLATTARTSNGSTIIAYIPTQRTVTLDMSKVSGGQAQAWWYNPRTNVASTAGVFATTGSQGFVPPDSNDWVLVIDDAALNLPAPGSVPLPPSGDTVPPTVAISSPAGGATVSGSISVAANASDNVGVVGVQFKLDGANLGSEDTGSPYAVTWNTTSATNGSHALTAVARDAAGNTRTSVAISVTVNNAPPPPGGSITYVQGNASGATTVMALNVAFPTSNTAGNLIVVTARASAQSRTWTITDARGNTYYLASQFNSTAGGDQGADIRVYYAYNVAAGANTVTVSISGATTRLGASIREYSGFGTANPLGQSSSAQGTGTFVNSGTVTTTAAKALIIGFGTNSYNATYTAGSGFGNLLQHLVGRVASQDRIVSSVGAYNSTMTMSTSLGWASTVVTFKQ